MPIYTVHEPPRRDDELLAHTARFRFVRDGFHFWALLFGPLWMLRHRLWLETIAYLVIVGLITFALTRFGASGAAGWVALLISFLIGMEASSLRRWKLSRRGYENVGVVVGDDLEDAERRFFDGWVMQSHRSAMPSAPSPFEPPSSEPRAAPADIVGLFPQPEARA